MRRSTILALSMAALAGLGGCNDAAEPAFETGTVEFDFMAEGETTASSWVATGSCGERGFDLGSATCAVGSEETRSWVALGVISNPDDTYDTFLIVTPRSEGTCTAAAPEPADTQFCTAEFVRGTVDFPEDPVPTYLLTSGTITIALEDGRLVGSFEGVAEDQTTDGPPLTISDGTFDVQFVR